MKTKEEYLLALDRIDNAYNNFDRSISAVGMFIQDFNLLLGLVNEHFEDKQETNFEHYFEYLSKLNMGDFALIDGRFTKCTDIICSECDFNGGCIEGKFKWLKQPYEKPKYKLTKFEKELLQCYPDISSFKAFNSLNVIKKKGYFKGIDDNEIIGDILAKCEVIEDRKEVIKND